MSVWDRIRSLFSQKVTAALDRAEDPRESLELAYRKQLGQLQTVRRSVADVLTSQKRLEIEVRDVRATENRLRGQAADAVRRGSDDDARRLLTRAAANRAIGDRLDRNIAEIKEQLRMLEDLVAQLGARVEAFRAHKETARAQFTASSASVRAGEALTGISADTQDLGPMVERAHQKLLDLQARAAAIEQLAGQSSVDAPVLMAADPDRAELAAAADADLAELKRSLPPPAVS